MSVKGSVRAPSPTSFAARKQRTQQSAMLLSKAPTAPVMSPQTHDRQLEEAVAKERLPVSLGAIRSKIKLCILQLEKDVLHFQQLWLKNAADDSADTWTEFVKSCLQRIGHYSGIKDYLSFEIILEQVTDDEDFIRRREYAEMKDLCRRAIEFSHAVFKWREKLVNKIKHNLEKYCLTMATEAELLSLKSVDDYESERVKYENEMYTNMVKFDSLLENIQEHVSPFSKYLDNYSKVLHYMNGICETVLAACQPAKKWIMKDECYVANLTAEINQLFARKSSMTEELRKATHHEKDVKYRIFKGSHSNDRLELKLKQLQQRQRQVFVEIQLLIAAIKQLHTDINTKNSKLAEKVKQAQRQISPRSLEALAPEVTSIKDDHDSLSNQLLTKIHEKSKLENENANLSKEISKLILEIDTSKKRQSRLCHHSLPSQKDVEQLQMEFQYLSNKMDTLAKIKELKTSSDTVKKINYFEKRKFRAGDMKEKLAFACRLVAEAIPNDWVTLYHKLPFSPERDYDTRVNDLKVIQRTCERWDPCTTTQMAIRSLQKWQRVSATATIEDMVGTLRHMKKGHLAEIVEMRIKSNKWTETGIKLY